MKYKLFPQKLTILYERKNREFSNKKRPYQILRILNPKNKSFLTGLLREEAL